MSVCSQEPGDGRGWGPTAVAANGRVHECVCACVHVRTCVSVMWADSGVSMCIQMCVCLSVLWAGPGDGGEPREAFVLTLKGDHCNSVLFIT